MTPTPPTPTCGALSHVSNRPMYPNKRPCPSPPIDDNCREDDFLNQVAQRDPQQLLDALQRNGQLPHVVVMHNTNNKDDIERQNTSVSYALCMSSELPEWIEEAHGPSCDVGLDLSRLTRSPTDKARLLLMENLFDQRGLDYTKLHHFEVYTSEKYHSLQFLSPSLYTEGVEEADV